VTRALEPLLGRLEGRIDGQTIRVTRRHVGDLVVWLGDKTIDWDRPVRVEVDGAVAFEGRLARDRPSPWRGRPRRWISTAFGGPGSWWIEAARGVSSRPTRCPAPPGGRETCREAAGQTVPHEGRLSEAPKPARVPRRCPERRDVQ